MKIQFQFGANDCNIEVDHKDTVGDLFDMFTGQFGIPKDAVPYVNGVKTNKDHVLADGEKIEFKKESGRKG